MADFDREVKERRLEILEQSLGCSIMRYLHDDNVTEILVNPDGKLWIDTFDHGFEDTGIVMDPDATKRVIYAVADLSGQVIDLRSDPSLQADIPPSRLFSNCRFQAELPMIVTGPSFNIRKHSKTVFTLDDYVDQGTMTVQQKAAILAAIHGKKNIIAAGGTASGKTTLLNAILAEISNLVSECVVRFHPAGRAHHHDRGYEGAPVHSGKLRGAHDDGQRRYGQLAQKDLASFAQPHRCRRGTQPRSAHTH